MKNINKKFLLCAKTPHNLMLHGVNVGDPAEIRTPDTLLKRQVQKKGVLGGGVKW